MKLLPIKRVVAMIYCTVCSICVFTPWIASADCSNAPPQRIVVFPLYAEEIIYGLVEPERIIYVGHHYAEIIDLCRPYTDYLEELPGGGIHIKSQ